MRKVMLMAAPNGARKTKADHPALPLTAQELADTARDCMEAGASAIHLHARDETGAHTLEPAHYLPLMKAVRAATGGELNIQITTEAVGRYGPAEQMACVRATLPQAASLALKELAPDDEAETLERARGFFRWLSVMGISPQFILYSPEDVRRFSRLRADGVIPFARPFVLMVLGRYAENGESEPEELDAYVEALGDVPAHWAVCAFGRKEARAALRAARLGGHARIGFENNDRLPDGRLAPDNAVLMAATRDVLEREGFALMTTAEARALLAEASKC